MKLTLIREETNLKATIVLSSKTLAFFLLLSVTNRTDMLLNNVA